MSLNRAQILARKPKILTVQLPDSEESVIIRRMSALDWERVKERDPKDINFGLQLCMVLCDAEGTRQFDPDNEDDVKVCGDQFGVAEAAAILGAAGKLSFPPKKEDISKNLEAVLSSDSVSISA